MPSSCAVTRCVDKYCQSKEVSYHKFPSDPEVLRKWCAFSGRSPEWKPSRWSSICSRHFSPECYKQYFGKRVLKHDAVPTLESGSSLGYEPQKAYIEVPVPANLKQDLATNQTFVQEHEAEQEEEEHEDQPGPSLEQIIESLCRLCGGTFHSKQLVCYSSFLNLIIKCFPTLNLETYEYFPRQICTDCREKLINFSIFIDKTMSAQAYLIDRLVYNLPNPTNCFDNKRILPRIKQEPICVVKEERRIKSKIGNTSTNPTASGVTRVINIPSTLRIPFPPVLPAPIQLPPKITRVDDDIQILDPAPMKVEEIMEGEDEESPAQAPESLQITMPPVEVPVVEHNYSKHSGKIEILEERVFKTEPFWTEPQVCDMCGSTFDSSRSLDLHKATFHPNAVRVCLACDLAFWSVHEYLVHKLRLHPSSVPKTRKRCTYCRKTFARDTTRRRHIKSCRLKQKLKCPSCDLEVRSIRELITHECLPGEIPPTKLQLSVVSESNNQQSDDGSDEIIFVTEDGHMIGKPVPRSEVKELALCIKEPELVKTPPLPTGLTVTKQTVTTTPSEIIKETVTCVERTINANSPTKPLSLNSYKCPECGLKFPTKELQLTHKLAHRPPQEWNAPCHHCCKTFDTRNDLEQHCKNECPVLQRQVFISKQRPFHCSTCNAQFGSHYSLKMHENIHTRAVTYPCEYCGKVFVTKQNLIQHLASHSDTRKHSCHLCSRTFKFPSGLRQHINGYHLKIKPHVCSVCQRSYLLKSDMMKCRHSALTRQEKLR